MKNVYSFLLLVLSIALISSCASTNNMTLSVVDPAPVDIANNVKTVGIVNRSLPSDKNKMLDKIDQVLTIEGKNLDKEGAEEAVNGLKTELTFNKQFTAIKTFDSIGLTSNGLGIFPAPLSWDKVTDVCNKNNVDILYVLEFFDTDSKTSYSSRERSSVNAVGLNIPIVEHTASITNIIKTGWRIYDPVNKTIDDEFIGTDRVTSVGTGLTPLAAVKAVQGRKQAVTVASNNMGNLYARRILPVRHRVSRQYYVRGSNNFKIARRRAQTGDWAGAADLWNMELLNTKRKTAARAHYNMAIYREIEGDLDGAIEYASKAYTDYNDRRALRYLNILNPRKRNIAILEQQ